MTGWRPLPAALLMPLAMVTVLSGCSSGGTHPSAPAASSSSSLPAGSPESAGSAGSGSAASSASSAAPASPTAPLRPRQGACYRLTRAELTQPTNDSRPVACTTSHTARTIYVGRLRTEAGGRPAPVTSSAVQRQLSSTCPRRLAAYVGGSRRTRELSRLDVVWYRPTLAQSGQGAEWFRCDLIAFGQADTLLTLPSKDPLAGVLTRPRALDSYGLCGTAAPGARGFQRVACGRAHSWRAVDTIALAGGATYPGSGTLRKAGDGACKAIARARSGSLKFSYGWEWPTATQWAAGQHFGYCWVPG